MSRVGLILCTVGNAKFNVYSLFQTRNPASNVSPQVVKKGAIRLHCELIVNLEVNE
jgi:hypothetical protein